MRYEAVVEPVGNGAGVEVPTSVNDTFDAGRRPKVVITINGHSWRSAVVLWDGRSFVGIGARNRTACGIAAGDLVTVDLELDSEPREVAVSHDLAEALSSDPRALEAFQRLPQGKQRGIVVTIERAKADDTRRRRVREARAALRDG